MFYLNRPHWDATRDGGALRVYAPDAPPRDADGLAMSACDINPVGGTFIIFRSDVLVHEVLPAHSERCALTVWLYAGTLKQQRKAAGQ